MLFSYAGNFLKEQSIRVGVINNIWLFCSVGDRTVQDIPEEVGVSDSAGVFGTD